MSKWVEASILTPTIEVEMKNEIGKVKTKQEQTIIFSNKVKRVCHCGS